MGEVIKINNRRNECNVQELKEWLIVIKNSYYELLI